MGEPMRSYDAWAKSAKNFTWLGDAVPGGMDVDLLVERRGLFLIAKAKPWTKGVVLPLGQHLALQALASMPEFEVWLIGECADSTCRYLAEYSTRDDVPRIRRGGKGMAYWPADRFEETTMDGIREYLRGWWDKATEAGK